MLASVSIRTDSIISVARDPACGIDFHNELVL